MLFTKILNKGLSYLYPQRCPVCHNIVVGAENKICPGCIKELPIIKGARCKKCSKPLIDEEVEYCFDCQHKKHYFDEGYAVLLYDAKMQKSMAYFKFHGRREYGEFYAELLIKAAKKVVNRWQIEVLLPVPIHKGRISTRGYNQAEVIGRVLSQGLTIPIRTDLIKRVKNTKAQKELNIDERKQNVRNAFALNSEVANYQKVLIIDDIYTTGSTVDEIAKELLKSGVQQVFFLTVCIGGGF